MVKDVGEGYDDDDDDNNNNNNNDDYDILIMI
jgi:hypothetical protein